MKPTLVIAGATGFIGRWFIDQYKHKYRIIALSRRQMATAAVEEGVEWRQVELYSLSSTEAALRGADYALYLVHSMQPSTRLSQGTFDDTDLLLADNFVRAASKNGLKQILFLGGLLPEDDARYSRHLRSRYEVERTLASRDVPLTVLRAGLILGPGGSSFRIIEKLVRRLPVMACPKWTQSETQPIALQDTLQVIDCCLGNEAMYGETYDIGGAEVTTYVDLMKTTARLMGLRRWIFTLPFFSPGLSKLWVAFFADASTTLVSPLVDSLRHRLLVAPNELSRRLPDPLPLEEAIRRALNEKDSVPPLPPNERLPNARNTVRSVQRLPNPQGRTATWAARMYQAWLPRSFRYLIRARPEGDTTVFHFLGLPLLKLLFVDSRSDEDRQLFYIVGGVLAHRKDYGWLEFRRVLDGKYIISAIHEFVPTLPWYIYILSQALLHLWVMRRFGKFLASER